MTETTMPPAAPTTSRAARPILGITALIEGLGALSALPILFGNLAEVPGPGIGGWTVLASVVLRALFAVAALVYVTRGNLRAGIFALAGVVLANWLNFLPSVVLHGLEFQGSGSLFASAHFIVSPIPALAAAALAWKDPHRLGLPAVLVALPTLIDILGTLAFAVGVMIYGF